MSLASSFGPSNSGIQIGVNNGSINFNLDQELPTAEGAAFDSYDHQHEERCLPGTRIEVLSQIQEWAASQDHGKCIFWLNGMAGTGKSTISRTVAEIFSQANSLGASFFFKRSEADRASAKGLFPTIAKQLTVNIPRLRPYIEQAVLDNLGIKEKMLQEQFSKLLLQPLRNFGQSNPSTLTSLPWHTVIMVIDALDECTGDNDIRLILHLLPKLQKVDNLQIRVFLTSRPELPIRLGFSELAVQDHRDLILHEIPESVIKHDISIFLRQRLSQIRTESLLPDNWPGDENVEKLVTLSIPLFIFAATICRIFADPNWDPMDSLDEILAHQHDQSNMDRTYLPILDQPLNGQTDKQRKKLVEEFQHIIGPIVMLESPLSVGSISRLLELPERAIQLRLTPFHSVLKVPTERNVPICLFHMSFRDYLVDPATSSKTPLTIDVKATHYRLTIQCLSICQQNLRKNICELPSYGIQRKSIDRSSIDHYISPELHYSCRHWISHLAQGSNMEEIFDQVFAFLKEHFLHWLEAMTLLGLVSKTIEMLCLLQKTIRGNQYPGMFEFLYDAKRFLLKNLQIVDDAPLQLYCSALVFVPQKTMFRTQFQSDIPDFAFRLPKVKETWNSEIQILEGHKDKVNSVVFSPNGVLLAFGSHDGTIRMWDTTTGVLQQTIEAHFDLVYSVAFSPDGTLLASSSNETVRLWEIVTGAQIQIFEKCSHTLAFSPDGVQLACGSSYGGVELWDLGKREAEHILQGHAHGLGEYDLTEVNSVAFSPDGRLLACGSADGTIHFYNIRTDTLQQVHNSQESPTTSVAFSPDGKLLVSGGKTIRLWDTATGALMQKIQRDSLSQMPVNQFGSFYSVAFSANSALLASGSQKGDVQIWDTAGVLQQTFLGHSEPVYSVIFSPNGRFLASGSADRTIRLWDTATVVPQQSLEDYSSPIDLVIFSSDGRLLASVSRDYSLRLWNAGTGTILHLLEGHLDPIRSVAFSPNGEILVSSGSETIYFWDTTAGTLQKAIDFSSGPTSQKGEINSLVFSPDGGMLAFHLCGSIFLWYTRTNKLLLLLVVGHTFKIGQGQVDAMESSLDNVPLASSSDNETIKVWSTQIGPLQDIYQGYSDWVNSLTFSPNGAMLASSSNLKTIKLWNMQTGIIQRTFMCHSHWVCSLAFSPNGVMLAAGSRDKTIELWNMVNGAHQTLKVTGAVTELKFDQDGSHIVTNLGTLALQAPCGSHPLRSNMSPKVFIEKNWIMIDGKKALWLPPEYRPTCSAVSGDILALGHASGLVSFLGIGA
ncbi:hypothetical protein PENSTE_c005G00738 [Penicillium steckii]|uniref:NACHT domain-containing protein n=1 Tax=Penicillium steckii TaxID=303698 RepID=A0A1V6TJH5_9EURO|nr:hypothetical protein PENSTE_c005G00738 [Penicillium steckii]